MPSIFYYYYNNAWAEKRFDLVANVSRQTMIILSVNPRPRRQMVSYRINYVYRLIKRRDQFKIPPMVSENVVFRPKAGVCGCGWHRCLCWCYWIFLFRREFDEWRRKFVCILEFHFLKWNYYLNNLFFIIEY